MLRNWKWSTGVLFIQLLVGGGCYLLDRRHPGAAMMMAMGVTFLCVYAASGRERGDIAQIEGLCCGMSALFAMAALFEFTHHSTNIGYIWLVPTFIMSGMSAIGSGDDPSPWKSWFLNSLADLPLGIGFVLGGLILLRQRKTQKA